MAWYFDAAAGGDSLKLTDPVGIDLTAAWTIGGVFRPISTDTDGRVLFKVGDPDTGFDTGICVLFTASELVRLRIQSGAFHEHSTTLSMGGAWYKIAAHSAGAGATQKGITIDGSKSTTNMDATSDLISGDQLSVAYALAATGAGAPDVEIAMLFALQGVDLSGAAVDSYCDDPCSLIADYGPSGSVTANALKLLVLDDLTIDLSGVDNHPTIVSGSEVSGPTDYPVSCAAPSAALTGTAAATIDEADIVAGGKTVILTLTGATWEPAAVTRPVIEAADCTLSGSDTAADPWTTVAHPACNAGDLLIWNIAWDDSTNTTGVTGPSGQNGETLTEIVATPVSDSSTESRSKAWYCVTTAAWTAGNLTFDPSASEQWAATVIRVPAGEFDPITPIGAIGTSAATTTNDTTVDSPAFNAGASDGGGCLVWFAGVDADPLSGTNPTGWTIRQSQDIGAVAQGIATRDAAVTDSESIASATWSITSDSWTSIAYVVRGPKFDHYRQAIINGLDSAQSEGTGWDAVVKAGLAVTAVARTSDTVVTVTLSAFASYDITATETITATVPAAALVSGGPIVASPTFTIDTDSGEEVTPGVASALMSAVTPTLTPGPVGATASPADELMLGNTPAVLNVNTVASGNADELMVAPTPSVAPGPAPATALAADELMVGNAPTVTPGPLSAAPPVAGEIMTAPTPAVLNVNTVSPGAAAELWEALTPDLVAGSVEATPPTAAELMVVLVPLLAPGALDAFPGVADEIMLALDQQAVGDGDALTPPVASALMSAPTPTLTPGPLTVSPEVAAELMLALTPGATPGPVTLSPAAASALMQAITGIAGLTIPEGMFISIAAREFGFLASASRQFGFAAAAEREFGFTTEAERAFGFTSEG